MDDLFGASDGEKAALDPSAPLAARMRPRSLEEYVGQQHILGPGKLLRTASPSDRIGSAKLHYSLRAAGNREDELGANHRLNDRKPL